MNLDLLFSVFLYCIIGLAYYAIRDFEHATEELRRSLKSAELAGASQHIYMSRSLVYLGNSLSHVRAQSQEQRQRYHRRAVSLVQQQFDQRKTVSSIKQRMDRRDSLTVANGFVQGSGIWVKQGMVGLAIEMLQAALALRSYALGPSHALTKKLQETIAEIQQKK